MNIPLTAGCKLYFNLILNTTVDVISSNKISNDVIKKNLFFFIDNPLAEGTDVCFTQSDFGKYLQLKSYICNKKTLINYSYNILSVI